MWTTAGSGLRLRFCAPLRAAPRDPRGSARRLLLRGLFLAAFLPGAGAAAETNAAAPAPALRDPHVLYREVEAALAERDFAAARERVDALLAVDPGYADAYRARGYIAFEQGRYRDAERDLLRFRRALGRDRYDLFLLLGRTQLALGKLADAAASFEKVRILKPSAAGIYTSLGRLYYRLERFATAVDRLEAAVQRDPPRFRDEARELLKSALLRHAERLIANGREDQAVYALSRIIEIDPPLAVAFLRRGMLLATPGGDLEQAEQDLLAYLAEQSGEARGHLLLGRIRQQRREWSAAAESYLAARAVDPAIPGLDALLGILYHRAGRPEPALRHLRAAIAADNDDAASAFNLGTIQLRLGRVREAEEAFELAARRAPDAARPRLMLARTAVRRHDIENTLSHLEAWSERVRGPDDVPTDIDLERTFQLLYNDSRYRDLIDELRERVPKR